MTLESFFILAIFFVSILGALSLFVLWRVSGEYSRQLREAYVIRAIYEKTGDTKTAIREEHLRELLALERVEAAPDQTFLPEDLEERVQTVLTTTAGEEYVYETENGKRVLLNRATGRKLEVL